MSGWRRTPHGEWLRDGLGIVAAQPQRGYWAYRFDAAVRLGPFHSLSEAFAAVAEAEAPTS